MVATIEPVEYEVHGETVFVDGIKRHRCQGCGEEILRIDAIEELRKKANEYYKKAHELLTGDEIRAIRYKLGVSQSEIEGIIKAGEKTFTRWESNKVIQSGIADSLLRVLGAVPGALAYLKGMSPVYSRTIAAQIAFASNTGETVAEVSGTRRELMAA